MPSLAARFAHRIGRFADRPSYPALVGTVAAIDYVVPGAPTNAVLISAVLPRPARWRLLGVAFAIGDAVGAAALAGLIALFGDPIVAWAQGSEAAPLWNRIEGYVAAYGLLTLAALAVTPLPTRIATAILALTGTAPLVIAGVVLAGRLVAYPAVAYLAARTPAALARLGPVARFLERHRPPAEDGRVRPTASGRPCGPAT